MMEYKIKFWYFLHGFVMLYSPVAILICSILIAVLAKGSYKAIGLVTFVVMIVWYSYYAYLINGNI